MATRIQLLRCWLGHHDWEVLRTVPRSEIEDQVRSMLRPGRPPGSPPRSPSPPNPFRGYCVQQVCLQCGKVDDQVTEYRMQSLRSKLFCRRRQRVARRMFELHRRTEAGHEQTLDEKYFVGKFFRDEDSRSRRWLWVRTVDKKRRVAGQFFQFDKQQTIKFGSFAYRGCPPGIEISRDEWEDARNALVLYVDQCTDPDAMAVVRPLALVR